MLGDDTYDAREPMLTMDPRVVPRAGRAESKGRGSWVFMTDDSSRVTIIEPRTFVSRKRMNSAVSASPISLATCTPICKMIGVASTCGLLLDSHHGAVGKKKKIRQWRAGGPGNDGVHLHRHN